jgi:hypothetical protein
VVVSSNIDNPTGILEGAELGENLPQYPFVHHKPHMLCPEANPGRRGGKPETNRLSYGKTFLLRYFKVR